MNRYTDLQISPWMEKVMVVHGTYKNGIVQLDEKVDLTEGQRVAVDLRELPVPEGETTVWQELAKLSGILKSGRRDGSVNHDHYIYGTPKRETPE
jgi:predicted DNA-binding antitoxin AbrB/MazE fold protein